MYFFVASGNRIDTKNLKDKKSMFLRQHRPLISISTIHNKSSFQSNFMRYINCALLLSGVGTEGTCNKFLVLLVGTEEILVGKFCIQPEYVGLK